MRRSSRELQAPPQRRCILRATLSLVLSVVALSISGPSSEAAQLGSKAKLPKPCCVVTTVDAQTGTITASENSTGRTFSFQVTNSNLLLSLKVGQGIYANFTTQQVSIDGTNSCCRIVSLNQGRNRGDTTSANLGTVAPLPGSCCSITSIDATYSKVMAKVNSTGRVFFFEVPNSALLNSLRVGQGIYANLRTKEVSLDGHTACCRITDMSAIPETGGTALYSQQTPTQGSPSSSQDKDKAAIEKRADSGKNDFGSGATVVQPAETTTEVANRGATAGGTPTPNTNTPANSPTGNPGSTGLPSSTGSTTQPAISSPSGSTPAGTSATIFANGQRQGPPNYGPIVPAAKCLGGSEAPDLRITELKFNSSRHVIYTVTNCGRSSTSLPFVVDLYINGARGDTVEHQILPGQSQQMVTSQLAKDQGCDRAVLLAIADPQHLVPESNTANNQMTADLIPPCPDLQVEEIKQHWIDANTRYQAQVKIGNRGNGPSEHTVFARVMEDAQPLGISLPENFEIPPLAPGQSFIFVCNGKHLVTTTTIVDVMVDIYKEIVESSPNNKHVHKTLGPH